jgi:hypothetical protein
MMHPAIPSVSLRRRFRQALRLPCRRQPRSAAGLACAVFLAALPGCTFATLVVPEAPSVPALPAPPPPPPLLSPSATYTSPPVSTVAAVAKKTPLAGLTVSLLPTKGVEDGIGIRPAIVHALVKAGLRVRDLEHADRVIAAHHRAMPGATVDLYGVYADVTRAVPAVVGGVLLWPEIVEIRTRTVEAGGEPAFEPAAAEAWRRAVESFETNRRAGVEQLEQALAGFKAQFETAWAQYTRERNFLQVASDGDSGPTERKTYRETLARLERTLEQMQTARPADLDETLAKTARKPETKSVTAARMRLVMWDARVGDVVGVYEFAAEGASAEAVTGDLTDATIKALGVKR